MVPSGPILSPSKIVRTAFAGGSIVFAGIGFFLEDGTRFYAASGAFSVLWVGWDFLVDSVFTPFEYWAEDMMAGGALPKGTPSNRTVHDRIRLLENRMTNGNTRRLRVHAAIRLAETYELQLRDPERAALIIERAKEELPQAPEWKRYDVIKARKRK